MPSLSPLVAYLLQLPVGRLKASALTPAGVLATVILVARHYARIAAAPLASRLRRPQTPVRPPEHAEPEDRHEMPIVVEGSAVPVHSIAFRALSLKQAQELARFAAVRGAFSPARRNLSDTVYQVRLPHSEHLT